MSGNQEVVAPGDELGLAANFHDGRIHAAVLGFKRLLAADDNAPPVVCVAAPLASTSTAVPEVGSQVLARVLRINPRQATLAILVVNDLPCSDTFQGVVRTQDVRATEKDKVLIYKSFRPGDIVRAQVISLGDSRSFYLSTAQNDLGVIFAQSPAGHTMIPISWEEMMCPVTLIREFRKCAKPADV
ncbi:hypothetical protein HK405_008459 [Cladochytrium tenue]|nr:hypothetical protein HK405_008459 [Cladochytrium tenue]